MKNSKIPHRTMMVPLLLVAALGTGVPGRSQDAPEKPPDTSEAGKEKAPAFTFKPPRYLWLRYDEDWSVLADKDDQTPGDSFDPIKYIPLTEEGDTYLSLGGQIRSRVEDWNQFGFNGVNDDTFWLNRFLLSADLHMTRYFRAFVEGKSAFSSARELPGGRRTLDVDELALQQAFGDLNLWFDEGNNKPRLTLRPGRQEYLFGAQRLVSPLAWSNTLRTWDGVSGIVRTEGWKHTGFLSQFVNVEKYEFNDSEPDLQFYGVYSSGNFQSVPVDIDLYWLGLSRSSSRAFNGFVGREDRQTLGARLYGDIARTRLHFEVEGAYQTGTLRSKAISAGMVSTTLGYKIPLGTDLFGQPRTDLGFDYASGGKGIGSRNTFNQLFPLGHQYLGYIDVIGRQNIIDTHVGITCNPLARVDTFKKSSTTLSFHYFWRASRKDALYNAGGGVVRAPTNGSQNVGSELDLTYKHPIDRHLALLVGYSHFFPATFIKNTGPDRPIDFTYLQLQFTF